MRKLMTYAAVAAASLFGAMLLAVSPSYSADKGGPTTRAAAVDADASWSGFGAGLKVGVGQGSADVGGPGINITGQTAGGNLFLRQQYGPLVMGVDAGYDMLWGDLKTFGIDGIYTVGGSIGVTPAKNSLLFVRGEWLRAQGSGGHLDGWGLGVGAEQRIANTPMSVQLLYMHDWMDKDMLGPGINVNSDRVMLGLNWQFGVPRNVFADR